MMPKLTKEQREALKQGPGPVAVQDEQSHQVYFLVDKATIDGADRDAIRQGILDMEAGRTAPLDEVMDRIRSALRLPTE